jgi:hypothetical protein
MENVEEGRDSATSRPGFREEQSSEGEVLRNLMNPMSVSRLQMTARTRRKFP